MTVRCFVSEAMVYRTLGDVDKALEAVDPADTVGALKAIEAYAVECSINKVATSEALAYAVDEAVQVFGGNGYSREFPVERAYRDARITRIYEGTNEINRLIIPTRLLKHGRVAAGARGDRRDDRLRRSRPSVRPLPTSSGWRGRRWRRRLKRFGTAVRDQQEVLAHAADVIIECYAIESALGRAEKIAARGSERAAIAVDIARVYTSDAMDRVAHAGKQIVNALAGQSAAIEPLRAALARVREHPGVDTVERAAPDRRRGDRPTRYPFKAMDDCYFRLRRKPQSRRPTERA